jgi:hypothetical protein
MSLATALDSLATAERARDDVRLAAADAALLKTFRAQVRAFLEGDVVAAAPAPAVDQPPPLPPRCGRANGNLLRENRELRAQLDAAATQIRELTADKARIQTTLEELRRARGAQGVSPTIQARINELERELAACETALRDANELRERLADIGGAASVDAAEIGADLEQRVNDTSDVNDELQRRLDALRAAPEPTTDREARARARETARAERELEEAREAEAEAEEEVGILGSIRARLVRVLGGGGGGEASAEAIVDAEQAVDEQREVAEQAVEAAEVETDEASSAVTTVVGEYSTLPVIETLERLRLERSTLRTEVEEAKAKVTAAEAALASAVPNQKKRRRAKLGTANGQLTRKKKLLLLKDAQVAKLEAQLGLPPSTARLTAQARVLLSAEAFDADATVDALDDVTRDDDDDDDVNDDNDDDDDDATGARAPTSRRLVASAAVNALLARAAHARAPADERVHALAFLDHAAELRAAVDPVTAARLEHKLAPSSALRDSIKHAAALTNPFAPRTLFVRLTKLAKAGSVTGAFARAALDQFGKTELETGTFTVFVPETYLGVEVLEPASFIYRGVLEPRLLFDDGSEHKTIANTPGFVAQRKKRLKSSRGIYLLIGSARETARAYNVIGSRKRGLNYIEYTVRAVPGTDRGPRSRAAATAPTTSSTTVGTDDDERSSSSTTSNDVVELASSENDDADDTVVADVADVENDDENDAASESESIAPLARLLSDAQRDHVASIVDNMHPGVHPHVYVIEPAVAGAEAEFVVLVDEGATQDYPPVTRAAYAPAHYDEARRHLTFADGSTYVALSRETQADANDHIVVTYVRRLTPATTASSVSVVNDDGDGDDSSTDEEGQQALDDEDEDEVVAPVSLSDAVYAAVRALDGAESEDAAHDAIASVRAAAAAAASVAPISAEQWKLTVDRLTEALTDSGYATDDSHAYKALLHLAEEMPVATTANEE